MLAKNVNDNACFLDERGACEFFASKLAPTKIRFVCRNYSPHEIFTSHPRQFAGFIRLPGLYLQRP